MSRRRSNLRLPVRFCLFATSYIPLFFLIALRQVSQNWGFLHWGGLNLESLLTFAQRFGLSAVGLVLAIGGGMGLYMSLCNMKDRVRVNGEFIRVLDVDDKSSDALGYVMTYVIPFAFQNYSDWVESVSIIFLLIVIYAIYVNSSLILVNPILSLRYSLCEVEFSDNSTASIQEPSAVTKKGLFLTSEKHLRVGDVLNATEVGQKLYFALPYARSDTERPQRSTDDYSASPAGMDSLVSDPS